MIIDPVFNVDFPWSKGWVLHENAVYGSRSGGKRMSDTVKKMLEQMFLLGNVHAKDRMTAKEMHDKLKESANNGEFEKDQVPKVSTIQGWISWYHKAFVVQATRTALNSEDISMGMN